MARITTYANDTVVTAQDKWVGTDFNGGITKNFTAQNVASFLNRANAVGIIGQANFLFQDDILYGRNNGTISFEAGGGIGTNFSAISTLKFSKYSSNNKSVLAYLQNLVGAQVILAQVDDINNFGIYTLDSFTQDGVTEFYDAVFTLVASNGALAEDKYYGICAYGTGSGGGGGATVTSYRSDAVGTTIYAGYLLNGNPVITRYIEGVLATAQGVTDLETDWANRLNLTYV